MEATEHEDVCCRSFGWTRDEEGEWVRAPMVGVGFSVCCKQGGECVNAPVARVAQGRKRVWALDMERACWHATRRATNA